MPLSMNAFALSATVLGAVVTTAALHRPATAEQPPAPAPAAVGLTRASALVGTRIVDSTGARLARVQDLVVEPSGAVVVIAQRPDGALVGVPLELLKPRVERRPATAATATDEGSRAPLIESLRLRAESERLVAATVFARESLDSLDQVALDGVRRHWAGDAPEPRAAADRPAAPRALCLGHARGDRVKNGAGETLGEIEDVVLDLPAARAAYVLLSCGGVLGVGATDHGVAPADLARSPDGAFVLAADRKTLDNSPGIDLDRLPSRPSLQVPAKVSLTDGSYAHRAPR